ncbi:MAG: hypothetical protein JNN12_11255 [Bacteroidetes Order II. Incertae sedis bacterium]|nr:hypothetical protein [Bacteroidetes Order II. bacterium]
MAEKRFEKVLEQFGALSLEEKSKFLLKATFETAFGAFEELTNLMAETYQTVTNERWNNADEKFKQTNDSDTKGVEVPISDEAVKSSPNFEEAEDLTAGQEMASSDDTKPKKKSKKNKDESPD